jgi:hypothetical protein
LETRLRAIIFNPPRIKSKYKNQRLSAGLKIIDRLGDAVEVGFCRLNAGLKT